MPHRVTEYLERARECARLADKMSEPDKATLMGIAEAWLKMADEAAKAAAAAPPPPTSNGEGLSK
jgi:hypothetical protein